MIRTINASNTTILQVPACFTNVGISILSQPWRYYTYVPYSSYLTVNSTIKIKQQMGAEFHHDPSLMIKCPRPTLHPSLAPRCGVVVRPYLPHWGTSSGQINTTPLYLGYPMGYVVLWYYMRLRIENASLCVVRYCPRVSLKTHISICNWYVSFEYLNSQCTR